MEENNLLDDNLDSIKSVSKSLINARKITLKEKNLIGDEKLSELDYVIESLKVSLKSADKILVSETHKSTISTSLTQIDSYLQNFIGNPVAYLSHLDSAISQANNIKNVFPYLVSKVDETGVENVRKVIYGIRQSASNQLRSLSEDFEKRTGEILDQVESLKVVSVETNETIKIEVTQLG